MVIRSGNHIYNNLQDHPSTTLSFKLLTLSLRSICVTPYKLLRILYMVLKIKFLTKI